MSVNAIHGQNAIVYLGKTAGGVAVVVGEQVDYDLAMKESFVDTTTLPNATGIVWNTQLKGPIGWGGKLAGKFDPTSTALWDASVLTGAMNMYLYPQASSMTQYYYGTAFVTLPTILSGGVKKEISNAVTLSGTGPLSRN